MLTKAEIKYINSLQNKKYRKTERAFFVEGLKNVQELLNSDYEVLRLLCTEEFAAVLTQISGVKNILPEIIKPGELAQMGSLETNNSALAVARTKEEKLITTFSRELVLALDGINDPGNLGTIIRIADWYGIKNIICSPDTVDMYNPKVINATKGSFTRVNLYYTDLPDFLTTQKQVPILAACMEGKSIYNSRYDLPAILLLGNEANGIRPETLEIVTDKITIPKKGKAESLNVGVATAILVDRLLN